MKPVFIIAIVAVAMIGVMVPSVFADHEELAIGTVDPSGFSEGYFPQYVQLSPNGLVTMINNDPTEVHTFTSGTVSWHDECMRSKYLNDIGELDSINCKPVATGTPNDIFDSGLLSYGDTFEWIPTHSGQYSYYCKIHSWMVGNIAVLDYHPNPVYWQEGGKFDAHGTFTVEELISKETSSLKLPEGLTVNEEINAVEEGSLTFNPYATTSNSNLQEKLNEYWNCSIGKPSDSNQDCVKNDEKHTVGIPPTEIADYQIEKDDTLTFVYEDSDISTKLATFREQSLHQDLWEIYTSITPPEILSEVVYFIVYTDDYEGDQTAAVQRHPDNFLKFDLLVDPVDMVPSGIKIDKQYYIPTLIHENAHILSLSASQSDNNPISEDAGNSPDMYKQEMKNGERSCAPNYYNDLAGCMNQNSYLNAFFQEFWVEIYDDFKWYLEFDDYETFYEHNTEFYYKYEKYWLTEYSSENPDEDFAESFMAFVLKEKPSAPTFTEQKILFFYQYPELVEMRDFIRSAIATFEFCDDGTVWKDGKCHQSASPPPQQQSEQSESGGCLIATATYGSELAPQVQQLRELRDNKLMNTESGKQFMETFNDVYYSFSPTIADMEREHPMFKEAVKLAITPMISTLSLMENAETESEVLSIGISVIALNLGMYLGVPAIVVVGIRKRF